MIVFLIAAVTALFLWFEYDRRRCAKYPPGPLRLPLIGNLIQLAQCPKVPYLAYAKLAETYGDIFYVRTGICDSIVFSSFETIKAILAHEHAQERTQTMVPVAFERIYRQNLGILFCNGKEWQTLRRFTIRTLRDFGFGKAASMDVVINEELEKFMAFLKKSDASNPNGIQGLALFHLTIINVMWRLVTGKEYEMDDEKIRRLLNLSHKVVQSGNFGADLAIAYPPLWHIFPNMLGKNMQLSALNELREYMRETIEYHRSLEDYKSCSNSYVDEFLAKIDDNKGTPDSEFTDDHLLISLLDLFQAGSDTTSNTLSFSMLYMILNPHIQEKVQKEIDAIVPREEGIMLSTKDVLPFTYATLLECTRLSVAVPLPPTRMASQDFYFKGYLIKKGMPLIANLHGLSFNESVWGDPHNFRPERFLTKEGQVDMKVAGNFLPFGHGPRKCLAASLAENSLFIYFATLMRNFTIVKAENVNINKLSIEPDLGFTQSPKPFHVRFVPRR